MSDFMAIWQNKWLTSEAKTIQDMIVSLRNATNQLEEMAAAGVVLDADGGTEDDYAYLMTTDPVIAQKYDMDEQICEEEDFEDNENDLNEEDNEQES